MLSRLKEYYRHIEFFIFQQFNNEGPFLLPAASVALLSYKNTGSLGNALFIALNGYFGSNFIACAIDSNARFGIKPDWSVGVKPLFVASGYFAMQQCFAQYAVKYITTNYIDKKYDYNTYGWEDSAAIFAATTICTAIQYFYTHIRNYEAKSKEEQIPTESYLYTTGLLATISTTALLLTYHFYQRKRTDGVEKTEEKDSNNM